MTDFSKKQDAAGLLQIDKDAHGILRVTLNDPARRNALSEAMLDRLGAILADAAIDASVRVIILAANGPAFCAGHDLKEMSAGRANADQGEAYFTDVLKRCSAVMQAILQNPKPVIAEVAATATAAGCQLVASCDLAFAAPSAKFSTPGVHIGLFCSTPMVALSRNVGNAGKGAGRVKEVQKKQHKHDRQETKAGDLREIEREGCTGNRWCAKDAAKFG